MAEQFGIFENQENNNKKKKEKEVNLALRCHHVAGLMQVVNEDKHVILMLFFILKSYY